LEFTKAHGIYYHTRYIPHTGYDFRSSPEVNSAIQGNYDAIY
jgi:hypothetical protein